MTEDHGDAERRKERRREDSKLWSQMTTQDKYVVEEFFTAVIGIGALFFAYATTAATNYPGSGYLALLIAFIGFGASIVVWNHEWGAHKQLEAIQEELKDAGVMERWKKINKWRSKWPYNYIYNPSSRLMTYFSALVALAWAIIIVDDIDYDRGGHPSLLVLTVVAVIGVGFVLIMIAFRKGQDIGRYGRKKEPAENIL